MISELIRQAEVRRAPEREDPEMDIFDDSQFAELPELLLQDPEMLDRTGRVEFVLRAMEYWGRYRYRRDRTPFQDRAPDALRLLENLVRNMEGDELDLLLRVLLLIPWEMMRRASGLQVRPADVVLMLDEVAPSEAITSAMKESVTKGPSCLARFKDSDVFQEYRQEPAIVLEFDSENDLIGTERIEVDRLHLAVTKFRPYRWEANLRPIVPRLLMRAEEKERPALLKDLMGRAEKKVRDAYGQHIALGLADWACEHTSHPGAEAVLDLVLAGRSGAFRKGAVDLADSMNRTDLLEKLARSDPDTGIRNRALKRLGKSPGQGNLFGRAGTVG